MSPVPFFASVLLLLSACTVPTGAGDPCAEARAHVADCLGTGVSPAADACDASTAAQIASASCEDVAAIAAGEKADYDDYVLCSLGFDSACNASVLVDDEDWFGFSLRDSFPGEHADRWQTTADRGGYVGDHYHSTGAGYDYDSPHDAAAWAEWRPTLPRHGNYRIRVWIAASSENSANAMYRVEGGTGGGIWTESGGLYEVYLDQRTDEGEGWVWLAYGMRFQLSTDPTVSLMPRHSETGLVTADALEFVPAPDEEAE